MEHEQLRDALQRTWWAFLLTGILTALVGLLLLLHPQQTLAVLAQLLGLTWLVGGAVQIGTSFVGGEGWGWRLLSGAIGMIAGFFVFAHPLFAAAITPVVLIYVLGISAIISGACEMVIGRRIGTLGVKWSWGSFFSGLLTIVLGGLLLANSVFAVTVIVSICGAVALILGIGLVIHAFQVRGAATAAAA